MADGSYKGRGKLLLTLCTTGFATLLAFAINFLLTPFITDSLGIEAYGFITLANTFTTYATIITIAINSFSTRYIALEYHKGDPHKASVYFSSVLLSNIAISLFLVMAIVVFDFTGIAFLNVPNDLMTDVQALLVIVFANYSITNIASVFQASAYIKNKLDIYGLFQVVSYLAEAVLLVFLYLHFAPKTYFFGLGLLVAGVVVLIGNCYIFNKYTPEIRIDFSLFSFSAVKDLLVNGVWKSVNSLGNVLNNGIGLLVSTMFLDAVALGYLSISRTFSSVFSRLYQLVAQAFQPMYLKSYSEGDTSRLVNQLLLASKVSGYVACIIFGGFVSMGLFFFRLWVPGVDVELVYLLTIVGVLSSFFEGQVNPLYYIYTLVLKNRVPTIITLISGCLNVLLMGILLNCTDLGVVSIAVSTTVVTSVVSIVTNPIYMAHVLGIPPSVFYKSFARVWIACGVIYLSFWAVAQLICPESWSAFALSAVALLILGTIEFYMVALNREEKRALVTGFVKKADK